MAGKIRLPWGIGLKTVQHTPDVESVIPSDARTLSLRRDDRCAVCRIQLPRGTAALWSQAARRVYCRPCAGSATLALSGAGRAGATAAAIYDRKRAADASKTRERWGIVAPLVEAITRPKQSTEAWAKGADGEARLGVFLERELAGVAILLHDRRIPGKKANIDHIAVGPSGVWVIDAKNYTGSVEKRDVGGLLRTDLRVFVNGCDQTKLVAKLAPQMDAVRGVLTNVPAFSRLPIRGAICFTSSDWGFFNLGKPFTIDDVLVTYPGALRDAIRRSGGLEADAIGRVAARLATSLRSASALRWSGTN